MDLQVALLHLHSILRWVILFLLLLAILKSLGAGNKPFTDSHRKTGLFLMIAMDIEFLLGLVQYFTGQFGFNQFQNMEMGDIMKAPVYRFFAVEHITMMFIALVLVHVGKSFAKKNIPDAKKHRKTVLFYVLALIVIIAAIPWPFREVGQGRGWW